jgi:hypothetical protein
LIVNVIWALALSCRCSAKLFSHLWPKAATNYRFSSRGQPGDKSGNPLIPAQLQQTSFRKASSFMSCMSNVNPIKNEPKKQSAQVTMCENPVCK